MSGSEETGGRPPRLERVATTGRLGEAELSAAAALAAGIPYQGSLRDEGPLPAAVHVRRALGGPLASLVLTCIAAAIALALRPLGGVLWWLALFFFLDNLLVLTLGAFLPLGFTDGSTLPHWWGKQ